MSKRRQYTVIGDPADNSGDIDIRYFECETPLAAAERFIDIHRNSYATVFAVFAGSLDNLITPEELDEI